MCQISADAKSRRMPSSVTKNHDVDVLYSIQRHIRAYKGFHCQHKFHMKMQTAKFKISRNTVTLLKNLPLACMMNES